MECETALWHAQKSSLGVQPPCNGGGVGEESEPRRCGKAAEISKIPMSNLRASAPTPAATHDGMYFRSGCCSAPIQRRQRDGGSEEIPCQFPDSPGVLELQTEYRRRELVAH